MRGHVPVTFLVFHLVGFALLTILAGFFFGCFLWTWNSEFVLVSLGCTATAILLLPILVRGGRDYDLMEPINFVIPAVFFGTTLKTIFIVLYPSERTTNFLMVGNSNEILYVPLVTICGALACLALGYSLPVPRLPVALITNFLRDREWQVWRFRLVMLGSMMLAGVCMVTFIRALGPEAFLQISAKRQLDPKSSEHGGLLLLGVAQLTYCCYFAVARLVSRERNTWPERILLMVAFLMLASFYTFISTRTLLLNMVVYSLMLTHYLRGSIRVQHVFVSLAFVLATVSFIGGLRSSESNRNPGVMDALTIGTSRFIELAVNNRNYLGAPETAIVLNGVPRQLDYQYGGTMITWAYAPIPRDVWIDKPERIRVGYSLNPLFKRETTVTGATPGVVGELYLNYGFYGVFSGMLCLGMWLKTLYTTFKPYFSDKNVLMVYMVSAFPMGYNYVATDLTGAVLYNIQGLIFINIFVLLVSRPGALK